MENFSEVYGFHGLYGFHGFIDLLVSGFHELIALLGFGFIAESSGPFQQTVSALFFTAKIRQIQAKLGFRISYFSISVPATFHYSEPLKQ